MANLLKFMAVYRLSWKIMRDKVIFDLKIVDKHFEFTVHTVWYAWYSYEIIRHVMTVTGKAHYAFTEILLSFENYGV